MTPEPVERCRWIALSNTTLGSFMAFLNQTIVLISLPVVFKGLHVDPVGSGQTSLLLWVLMSYNVASTVTLGSIGRISDTFGKVRFYNLGFVVFTIGSLLCAFTPGSGNTGAVELVAFRFVQGVGGACLMANGAAILTDVFPLRRRGFALGLNQVVGVSGSVVGLVVGGILATFDWRLVFLVNVPIGLAGSIWAYTQLKETGERDPKPLDPLGNLTFASGLLALLIGTTYALLPYGGSSMGWGNPFVVACLAVGVLLLAAFLVVESRVAYPMVRLSLFKIRDFWAGNLAGFLAAVGRGGLQFMLVIWLQGIWLPLHGVAFQDTPLQAGIDTLPMMAGFVLAGPAGGVLSDRIGARGIATVGMLVSAAGFLLLTTLPTDFSFPLFAFYLFLTGVGMGLFSAPNTGSIMSSVPARYRAVASGMRATFMNAGMVISMAVFFTVVITGLGAQLPQALRSGLMAAGAPLPLADRGGDAAGGGPLRGSARLQPAGAAAGGGRTSARGRPGCAAEPSFLLEPDRAGLHAKPAPGLLHGCRDVAAGGRRVRHAQPAGGGSAARARVPAGSGKGGGARGRGAAMKIDLARRRARARDRRPSLHRSGGGIRIRRAPVHLRLER